MGCKECGKPKCNGKCGCKSPKVLQINNPAEYITFHKVSIPAAMGDSTTNPPKIGAYRNALVYYEADHTSWMYSTDGIPTKLTNGLTDYNEAVNLPQINGHTLIGNQSSSDLDLQGKLTAGNGIELDGTEIKAKIGDGLEFGQDNEIKTKLGDGLEFSQEGEIDISDPVPEGFFDGVATDSGCGTNITLDNMIGGKPTSFELKGNTVQNNTPSPSTPVAIQVIDGIQTVTINEINYEVNLGRIKLCRIGTYIDRIYNIGDRWYVHKEIHSSHLGDVPESSWSTFNTSASDHNRVQTSAADSLGPDIVNHRPEVFCSHFVYNAADNYTVGDHVTTFWGSGGVKFFFPKSIAASISDWVTWLYNNNVVLYYPMAVATDEEITDFSLVSDLNNIKLAFGDNEIVLAGSGIDGELCLTGYNNNWSGLNGKLDSIVEDSRKCSSKIEAIFPNYGTDGIDTLGDCSIVKTANKTVMIDTFSNNSTCFESIENALSANNITSIDYFLVSHYDGDHYGNYQRIIDSGLIDNARIILPHEVVTGDINKTGSDIKAALTAAGLSYEEAENETIEIDNDVTMRLFNASTNDIDNLIALGATNYNSFSVCTEFRAFGRKILFPGDLLGVGLGYVANKYIIDGSYDLIKDCHHGFAGSDIDFVKKINPQNVLVPCSAGMVRANLGYRSALLNSWSAITNNIYPQGTQPSFTSFRIDAGGVALLTDSFAVAGMGSDGYTYYEVNNDTDELARSGSSSYPFKNLSEASAMIVKDTNNTVEISVAKLGSETDTVHFNGNKTLTIDFNNETPHGDIEFEHIGSLVLRNVSLSDSVITIVDCNSVYINNFSSSNSVDGQIKIRRSSVCFAGSFASSNATSAIDATYSDLRFGTTSLDFTQSGTGKILKAWNNTIDFTSGALSLFKNYKLAGEIMSPASARQNIINNIDELSILYETTTPSTSGSLRESINNYSKIKVTILNRDNFAQEFVVPITSSSDNWLAYSSSFGGGGISYLYSQYGRVKFNDTTFEITRQFQIATNISDGTIAKTERTDYVNLYKIIGVL